MNELVKEISKIGIVPVIVLNDAAKAVRTAKALLDGGIDWQRLPCWSFPYSLILCL